MEAQEEEEEVVDVGAARSDGVAAGEEGDFSGILRAAGSRGSRP